VEIRKAEGSDSRNSFWSETLCAYRIGKRVTLTLNQLGFMLVTPVSLQKCHDIDSHFVTLALSHKKVARLPYGAAMPTIDVSESESKP
jgi:hypothetical protein